MDWQQISTTAVLEHPDAEPRTATTYIVLANHDAKAINRLLANHDMGSLLEILQETVAIHLLESGEVTAEFHWKQELIPQDPRVEAALKENPVPAQSWSSRLSVKELDKPTIISGLDLHQGSAVFEAVNW